LKVIHQTNRVFGPGLKFKVLGLRFEGFALQLLHVWHDVLMCKQTAADDGADPEVVNKWDEGHLGAETQRVSGAEPWCLVGVRQACFCMGKRKRQVWLISLVDECGVCR